MIIAQDIRPVPPPPTAMAVVLAVFAVVGAVSVVALVAESVHYRCVQRLAALARRVIKIVQTVPDDSFSSDERRQRDDAVDWLTTVTRKMLQRRAAWYRSQTAIYTLVRLIPDELFRADDRTERDDALQHLDNGPPTFRWSRDARFNAKFATALLEELVSGLYRRAVVRPDASYSRR